MSRSNISISDNEKIAFISNFSTMFSAGIPILEIVDSLLEDSKGNLKKILQALKEDLIQGKRLFDAFASFPEAFDMVTVSIIRAAEEAGTLEETLKDVKSNIIKEIEFKDKIKGAMAYPVLIMGVFMAVLLMILIFIIPKIGQVFVRLKVPLPLPTKIMIFVSDQILAYPIPIIASTIGIGIAMYVIYKSNKRAFLNVMFGLPVLRQLFKEIDLTRFSRSLSLLLNAGVPITIALELTQKVVLKNEVANAISHTRSMVLSGRKMSEGFRDHKGVIPSIMIKITEAGEKSGSLEKAMQEVSEFIDYQVSKSLKTFTTLLEPIMLVIVGIMVGGMMLSIMAPVYGLIGSVGAR